MKKNFCYSVSVRYDEGYFENPETPRDVILGFASTKEQTKDTIKKSIKNATILNVAEITFEEFLEI